jgi:hypothetical protein
VIYILTHKRGESYETIGEHTFIFKSVPSNPTNFTSFWQRLDASLSKANPETDQIIFNGPNWLAAMAGYFWFSDERRNKFNSLMYSQRNNGYVPSTEELP